MVFTSIPPTDNRAGYLANNSFSEASTQFSSILCHFLVMRPFHWHKDNWFCFKIQSNAIGLCLIFTSLGLTVQWTKLAFIYLYVNLPINNENERPGNHEQHVEGQEDDPGGDSVQFGGGNVERFPEAALHDVSLVVEKGGQGVQEAG